jgi:hypothetical protein
MASRLLSSLFVRSIKKAIRTAAGAKLAAVVIAHWIHFVTPRYRRETIICANSGEASANQPAEGTRYFVINFFSAR